MNNINKNFIVLALLCVSATAAFSQDCNSLLHRATELVSQGNYCDALQYFRRYSNCDATADVSTEIAMCERRCRLPDGDGGGENQPVNQPVNQGNQPVQSNRAATGTTSTSHSVTPAATSTVSARTQSSSKMALGGHMMFALDPVLPTAGIGAFFQAKIVETVRSEVAFTYFLPKNTGIFGISVDMWVLSVNGHYLFPISNVVVFYPLVGVSLVGVSASLGPYSSSGSDVFFNIGGGMEINFGRNIKINFEPKYLGGAFMISSGIGFKF